MSIAALLYRLRPLLPERFGTVLLDSFWERFWEDEAKELGAELSLVPLASGGAGEDPSLASLPLRGSERAQLIERVAGCYPFKRALELGCAFGQNFYTLARLFPKSEFLGLDLDPHRVDSGNVLLREEGIANATLLNGDIRGLGELGGAKFDVIYSCASLLYLSGDEIVPVFEEIRSAKPKFVVLLEQNVEKSDPRHSGDPARGFPTAEGGGVAPYWHRDYGALLEKVFPESRRSIVPVPAPRWRTEEWHKFASLILVELR